MSIQSFRLNVDINIERLEDGRSYTGDRLSVREQVELGAGSFMEVAAVLGRFHELGQRIKAEAEQALQEPAEAEMQVTGGPVPGTSPGLSLDDVRSGMLVELVDELLAFMRPVHRWPDMEQLDAWAVRLQALRP